MILSIIAFIFSLLMILFAAEVFTNGVETFGKKFNLSQAVVGSILAAVGTAMPETILPLVAILMIGGSTAHEIGVGAILGAPFMLATLGFLLVGLTVIITYLRKQRPLEVRIELHSSKRDLTFFLIMYSLAAFVPLFTGKTVHIILAAVLFIGYLIYLRTTMQAESAEIEHFEDLYVCAVCRRLGILGRDGTPTLLILLQIIGALAVMVLGARTFVTNLETIAVRFGMSPLLFALFLAPIATELPEKFNSVSWTLKGKDTLALGNITGAMVFQSTFPVSVGLIFTDWKLSTTALLSAVIALVSALIFLSQILFRKKVSPYALLCGGVLYLVYLGIIIF